MTVAYVYPRLGRAHAKALLDELRGLDAASARERASTAHPAAAPVATGPQHVSEAITGDVARAVRELADSLGFPAPLTRPYVYRFDQPCGDLLVAKMHIIPADAASEEVWSFLTLVVLPDIAIWRFPDLAEERFVGRPRNVFRRLWWRSYTLGTVNAPREGGPEPLGEDELVNIFERPTLSRTAGLAQAMTRAVRSLPSTPGVPRSYVMRELAKRVRRLVSFLCLDALSEDQLDALVRRELEASVAALRSLD